MNKFTRILSGFIIFLIFVLLCSSCGHQKKEVKTPKYVFLFIGDGMGSNQVALTEAYLANITGEIGFRQLTMTTFPVFGQCRTYCKTRQITDSGAAGSAIACGEKAVVESISYYDDNENKDTKSIAKIAKENGAKVGIVSTVSLNHATPAAFYATSANRNSYYEIGLQLADSNFDFFGGGAFYEENGKEHDAENLFTIAEKKGYFLTRSLDNVSNSNSKVIFTNSVLLNEGEMPYCIDRQHLGGNTLSEIVESGIKFLDNPNGFFMMVEGSQIDWACHENDAATIVKEVIDFDNAIKTAYDFYLEHPDETLIVVTADHETGGLSLGISANFYQSNFALLDKPQCSQKYLSKVISDYKKENDNYKIEDIFNIVEKEYFSNTLEFTDIELKQISDAFSYYFYKKPNLTWHEAYPLYGDYNPISMTFTKIINNRASVGFTSMSHTGADVPVYTIGVGAEEFAGSINNTQIKEKIIKLSNWQ
jgi:alkaline phosphatase